MKLFLITSPRYNGSAEVLYTETGVLCKIDCMQTDMDAATINAFKKCVACHIEKLTEGFGSDTIVVEGNYEVSFEMFWKAYNKKINKFRCIKLWEKMEKTMQVRAYFGVSEYAKYLKKESWRTKADPETYLRNQYWDNEYK